MIVLIIGIAVFLGVHSLRIVAPRWREARIAAMGEGPWMGVYSLVSLVGFALIVWGFARAWPEAAIIYEPPQWLKHIAVGLMLFAFVFLAVYAFPAGRMKAALKHPMLVAIKVWALAHLLANGDIAALVLFGSFLAWAIVDRISVKRRGDDWTCARSGEVGRRRARGRDRGLSSVRVEAASVAVRRAAARLRRETNSVRPFHADKIPLQGGPNTRAAHQPRVSARKPMVVTMSMSDESFFREVNEELRQDRAKALWDRYGTFFIGLAVLVVLVTAAVVGWQYWTQKKANASGDVFSQALTLANDGKNDEALALLQQLEKDGYGTYPLLARMRAATAQAASGDIDAAVAGFDAVAADNDIPDAIRDMARLRAGLLLVDHGSYDDVAKRVEALTDDTNALRHSAREALGLAAWKAGKASDALALFDQIGEDAAAPASLRQRAQLMSELIRSSGDAA